MKPKVGLIGLIVMGLALPGFAAAADCPAEVAQAKSQLAAAQAALKTASTTKDVQPPRSVAGYEGGSSQSPRGAPQASTTDVQSPRSTPKASTGDVQAPRSTPKASTGDVQAPRATQGKVAQARKLINEAEQACKKGDMTMSSQKAKEAMAALK